MATITTDDGRQLSLNRDSSGAQVFLLRTPTHCTRLSRSELGALARMLMRAQDELVEEDEHRAAIRRQEADQ